MNNTGLWGNKNSKQNPYNSNRDVTASKYVTRMEEYAYIEEYVIKWIQFSKNGIF